MQEKTKRNSTDATLVMRTIREASLMTGFPYSVIREMIDHEEIEYRKSGNRYYVNVPSIKGALKGGKVKSDPE